MSSVSGFSLSPIEWAPAPLYMYSPPKKPSSDHGAQSDSENIQLPETSTPLSDSFGYNISDVIFAHKRMYFLYPGIAKDIDGYIYGKIPGGYEECPEEYKELLLNHLDPSFLQHARMPEPFEIGALIWIYNRDKEKAIEIGDFYRKGYKAEDLPNSLKGIFVDALVNLYGEESSPERTDQNMSLPLEYEFLSKGLPRQTPIEEPGKSSRHLDGIPIYNTDSRIFSKKRRQTDKTIGVFNEFQRHLREYPKGSRAPQPGTVHVSPLHEILNESSAKSSTVPQFRKSSLPLDTKRPSLPTTAQRIVSPSTSNKTGEPFSTIKSPRKVFPSYSRTSMPQTSLVKNQSDLAGLLNKETSHVIIPEFSQDITDQTVPLAAGNVEKSLGTISIYSSSSPGRPSNIPTPPQPPSALVSPHPKIAGVTNPLPLKSSSDAINTNLHSRTPTLSSEMPIPLKPIFDGKSYSLPRKYSRIDRERDMASRSFIENKSNLDRPTSSDNNYNRQISSKVAENKENGDETPIFHSPSFEPSYSSEFSQYLSYSVSSNPTAPSTISSLNVSPFSSMPTSPHAKDINAHVETPSLSSGLVSPSHRPTITTETVLGSPSLAPNSYTGAPTQSPSTVIQRKFPQISSYPAIPNESDMEATFSMIPSEAQSTYNPFTNNASQPSSPSDQNAKTIYRKSSRMYPITDHLLPETSKIPVFVDPSALVAHENMYSLYPGIAKEMEPYLIGPKAKGFDTMPVNYKDLLLKYKDPSFLRYAYYPMNYETEALLWIHYKDPDKAIKIGELFRSGYAPNKLPLAEKAAMIDALGDLFGKESVPVNAYKSLTENFNLEREFSFSDTISHYNISQVKTDANDDTRSSMISHINGSPRSVNLTMPLEPHQTDLNLSKTAKPSSEAQFDLGNLSNMTRVNMDRSTYHDNKNTHGISSDIAYTEGVSDSGYQSNIPLSTHSSKMDRPSLSTSDYSEDYSNIAANLKMCTLYPGIALEINSIWHESTKNNNLTLPENYKRLLQEHKIPSFLKDAYHPNSKETAALIWIHNNDPDQAKAIGDLFRNGHHPDNLPEIAKQAMNTALDHIEKTSISLLKNQEQKKPLRKDSKRSFNEFTSSNFDGLSGPSSRSRHASRDRKDISLVQAVTFWKY